MAANRRVKLAPMLWERGKVTHSPQGLLLPIDTLQSLSIIIASAKSNASLLRTTTYRNSNSILCLEHHLIMHRSLLYHYKDIKLYLKNNDNQNHHIKNFFEQIGHLFAKVACSGYDIPSEVL
jgi:hypothetical protein